MSKLFEYIFVSFHILTLFFLFTNSLKFDTDLDYALMAGKLHGWYLSKSWLVTMKVLETNFQLSLLCAIKAASLIWIIL